MTPVDLEKKFLEKSALFLMRVQLAVGVREWLSGEAVEGAAWHGFLGEEFVELPGVRLHKEVAQY